MIKQFQILKPGHIKEEVKIYTLDEIADLPDVTGRIYANLDKIEVGERMGFPTGNGVFLRLPDAKPELKLFYWEGLQSLRDNTSGMAFALAENLEQAILLVAHERYGRSQLESLDNFKIELSMNKPKVFTGPVGISFGGSA